MLRVVCSIGMLVGLPFLMYVCTYILCFCDILYVHASLSVQYCIYIVSNTHSCSPTFHLLSSLTVLRSGAAFSSNGGSTAVDSGLSRQDNTSTTVKTCLDQSKLKMCS